MFRVVIVFFLILIFSPVSPSVTAAQSLTPHLVAEINSYGSHDYYGSHSRISLTQIVTNLLIGHRNY